MDKRVQVGIAVLTIKNNKILFGKRRGSHGQGTWAPPGGKLEFGETFESCAKREILEETSLTIDNLRLGAVTNDVFEKESKHFVTIFMLCDYKSGEAKVMEPEKCEVWEWFDWDKLPQPLFIPIQNLLKQGFNPLNNL